MAGYTVYGDLARRETAVLTSLLAAKSLDFELVEETASLSLVLATRAGREFGPYLRTPEGFVLSDLHAMLDWIEQMHPERRLLPTMPVRRTCARLIEDWLEFWLPLWPRRSWEGVVRLGRHLEAAGFLLGSKPSRPDWLLAGWLETGRGLLLRLAGIWRFGGLARPRARAGAGWPGRGPRARAGSSG